MCHHKPDWIFSPTVCCSGCTQSWPHPGVTVSSADTHHLCIHLQKKHFTGSTYIKSLTNSMDFFLQNKEQANSTEFLFPEYKSNFPRQLVFPFVQLNTIGCWNVFWSGKLQVIAAKSKTGHKILPKQVDRWKYHWFPKILTVQKIPGLTVKSHDFSKILGSVSKFHVFYGV